MRVWGIDLRIPMARGALWSHADFLRLWSAQSVSAFGARITRTCVPLAAVLTIHASPAALGLLTALALGPGTLVGLFAGGFVDRSRRRRILIASDLLRAAILLTVPIAAWLHMLAMPQLISWPRARADSACCSTSPTTPICQV